VSDALIPRDALDRIIRRAAELQTHERDIGEGLTRDELLALGKDVGIPARYLHQALLEEQTRAPMPSATGLWGWLAGPATLSADRVVPGDRATVERALAHWMGEEESLKLKRRFPDHVTWEPKRGAIAAIERAFGGRGRTFALTRCDEVAGQVTRLEAGFCHVRLTAVVRTQRASRLGSAAALASVGGAGTLVALVLGVAVPLAIIPAAAMTLAGVPIARLHPHHNERVLVALDQALDRLEHGEIRPEALLPGPRPSAFVRIADEIKRTLEHF
jgi:hypothetical protein